MTSFCLFKKFSFAKTFGKKDKGKKKVGARGSINSLASLSSGFASIGGGSVGSLLAEDTHQALPNNVIAKIMDLNDNVFELVKWRCVSSVVKDYVDERLSHTYYLDVRKAPMPSMEHKAYEIGNWYTNKHDSIAIRFSRRGRDSHHKTTPYCLEINVNDKWSSNDVKRAISMITFFRKYPKKIVVDAAIAELVIVSLSTFDINRWHAYQCFMKVANNFEIKINPGRPQRVSSNTSLCSMVSVSSIHQQVFFPSIIKLTVKVNGINSNNLARIIEYGVKTTRVLNKETLEGIRIIVNSDSNPVVRSHSVSSCDSDFSEVSNQSLTDNASITKSIKKGVFNFRCWAGSCGFDATFCRISIIS
uniref:F-box domain-containing protein n=1 Tax=Rhabditophanes sp. KR3021 TaxID=114890 RepID=A0AC35U4E4_9BILA